MKFTICSEKRGKGSKAQPSPSAVPSGLRGGRSRLVAPSGPGPQTCSAVITEAVRSPTQLALGLFKPPKQRRGGQSCAADCYPGEGQLLLDPAAIGAQRQGWGRGSLLPQGRRPASGWLSWGLWSPAGHSLQPVPWVPPAHLLTQGQVSWRASGEKAKTPLLPDSPLEDHHSALHRHLTENPPLTVTHRQLVAWGRGHGGLDQWLSRAPNGLPVTAACYGGGGSGAQPQPGAKGCTWRHPVTF